MTINIVVWNVKGLNDFDKQKVVKKLVYEMKLDIIDIAENKVRKINFQTIFLNMFNNWQYVHNIVSLDRGRI